MRIAKRFGLLMVVNLLVVVTISLILSLLNVSPYLTRRGLDYSSLMIFCLVWGMGGAFISLGLSRIMARWMMGVQVIDPERAVGAEADLVQTVYRLARGAGISTMPQVGIYDSPEVNAFATGPTQNRSLVAVSSGLLRSMSRNEIEGVLGHEIAHVANGDMVTLTLIQGVMNAFVMFLARVVAFFLASALSGNRSSDEERGGNPMVQFMTTMVFEMIFGLLGMMVVSWFSRYREYRADSGGARLAGRENMVAALERLRRNSDMVDPSQPALAAFKISSRPGGFLALLSTHPPLEERIARLRNFS